MYLVYTVYKEVRQESRKIRSLWAPNALVHLCDCEAWSPGKEKELPRLIITLTLLPAPHTKT